MGKKTPPRDATTGQFVAVDAPERANPDVPLAANPRLFGEEIGDLAWTALGAGLTGAVNDGLFHPFVRPMIPIGTADDIIGKGVDAALTIGSAYVTGRVVKIVDGRTGDLVERGGLILGIAKVLSAVIPGFALTANFPKLPFPQPRGKQAEAGNALVGGGQMAGALPAPVNAAIEGSTGVPSGAVAFRRPMGL